jgi:molybdenum cofactor synthesis domain-containing protein
MRVAILTISDACARGERADGSGDAIAAWAAERGHEVAARSLVPDETGPIARTIAEWADGEGADLILTTGGTGLTARDVTPEATRAVLEREAPGIAEAIRASAVPRFPRAALSRGLAGVRGRSLIVNLPGSPGGVRDGLAVLDGIVDHAVDLVRGINTSHPVLEG